MKRSENGQFEMPVERPAAAMPKLKMPVPGFAATSSASPESSPYSTLRFGPGGLLPVGEWY